MVPGDTPMAAAMRGFCIVARRTSPNFVARIRTSMATSATSATATMTRLNRLTP